VAQAADTEATYYQAIAARQMHALQQQMATAATATADMAERFYQAGNIDALTLAMHQASASAAAIALSQQLAAVHAAQGALQIQLGLPATAPPLSIPAELPPPAAAIPPLDTLYHQADTARLDLTAARARANRLADATGVERRYRYLGELEIGVETERDSDGEHSVGPTLGWELPLFNQGAGRLARARAEWQAADAGLRALQIGISNDIRSHHEQLSAAAERVRAYDQQLLPLQTAIVRQTHRQVNFMLADVFTLLAARQQEYAAQQGRITALLDYWLAHAALLRAVGSDISTAGQLSAGEKLP
jgi:cobalt-zinc-cadmium efflux system outer membrane protein